MILFEIYILFFLSLFSNSSDLETPVAPREKPADAQAPKSPAVFALRAEEIDKQKRRLSRGVLASLEDLSAISNDMNKSYVAPVKADDGFVAALAAPDDRVPMVKGEQTQPTPQKEVQMTPVRSMGSFEADLERELQALNIDVSSPLITEKSLADIESATSVAKMDTPESEKVKRSLETQLSVGEEKTAAESDVDTSMLTQDVMGELGEVCQTCFKIIINSFVLLEGGRRR